SRGADLDVADELFLEADLRPLAAQAGDGGFVILLGNREHAGVGFRREPDGRAGFHIEAFREVLVFDPAFERARELDGQPAGGRVAAGGGDGFGAGFQGGDGGRGRVGLRVDGGRGGERGRAQREGGAERERGAEEKFS